MTRTIIQHVIFLTIIQIHSIRTQTQRANVLGCQKLQHCNGHGTCHHATGTCVCHNGWGSFDCSKRVCPFGNAWATLPTSTNDGAHQESECSNMGICDTHTGMCKCFDGFRGLACEYMSCPVTGDDKLTCSGHGSCMSMKHIAKKSNALPLSDASYTYNSGGEPSSSTITWDQDRIFGCVCDSSWDVGLGDGQRQQPEWFGADCSLSKLLRHVFRYYMISNSQPIFGSNEISCRTMSFR